METVATLTLVDELTGDSNEIEAGGTAAEVIERVLRAADHPRADFRARPLPFQLLDTAGTALNADAPVQGPGAVRLVSPEAAEIRARRDRWLADIETRGSATTSVSTATHLALIERTGSRLDDVKRLRAELAAQRSAPPPPSSSFFRPGRIGLLAGLGLVVVAVAAGAWFLGRDDDGVVAAGGSGDGAAGDGEVLSLPVDLDLELARGTSDRTVFAGLEGQNVTILMLAPQNRFGPGLDAELELHDADGQQIGYNDDRTDLFNAPQPQGVNGLNSRIDITLPADGDYTVISSDLSDTNGGSYRLVIEEGGPGGDGSNGFPDQPDFAAGAFEEAEAIEVEAMERDFSESGAPPPDAIGCGFYEPVEADLPFDDQVEAGCEIATLTFLVEEEGPVLMTASSGPSSDPIIWLLDEGGEVIAGNDDFNGLNSLIEEELAPGSYELLVGSLSHEPGVFNVVIERP